jgi:hypothetical protein
MGTHKILTGFVLVVTVLATMIMGIGSAAAQPANDDFANAYAISGPGFTDSGSTVDATESPDDPAPALGSTCGGGNTVWYSFTPATDVNVFIDTFGSAYDTTLGVYTGGPGTFSEVACNDDAGSLQSQVQINALAGVTYGVVIGTCCGAGNIYGSDYVISVSEVPPPFALDLTIDGGSVNKSTGSAIITGTVTCNTPGWFYLYILLEQRSGKFVARGEASISGPCDGATPVQVEIRPSGSVAFKSGRAGMTANANGCDIYYITCDGAQVVATIKL